MKTAEEQTAQATSPMVRVQTARLDRLWNAAGEMLIARGRLAGLIRRLLDANGAASPALQKEFRAAARALDSLADEIQESVRALRMTPLRTVLKRFPRLVRDLAAEGGKRVEISMEGGETEIDKGITDQIGDPLVHLIRNAVDHGIEDPDDRERSGKDPAGHITLRAWSERNIVTIQVADDGRGIDADRVGQKALHLGIIEEQRLRSLSPAEKIDLIFSSGLSTAEKVTRISGRGVGLDAVRANIRRLRGEISIDTRPGEGTTFSIRLPLALSVMDALFVASGSETYAVPLASVVRIHRVGEDRETLAGDAPMLTLDRRNLPLLDLARVLGSPGRARGPGELVVVEVGSADNRMGLIVDRVAGVREVVIKPLGGPACGLPGHGGATIQEDGQVTLVLDVNDLCRHCRTPASRSRTEHDDR